jgi:hypothetical protein
MPLLHLDAMDHEGHCTAVLFGRIGGVLRVSDTVCALCLHHVTLRRRSPRLAARSSGMFPNNGEASSCRMAHEHGGVHV